VSRQRKNIREGVSVSVADANYQEKSSTLVKICWLRTSGRHPQFFINLAGQNVTFKVSPTYLRNELTFNLDDYGRKESIKQRLTGSQIYRRPAGAPCWAGFHANQPSIGSGLARNHLSPILKATFDRVSVSNGVPLR